jgi:small-conductance mechanosensitive channel
MKRLILLFLLSLSLLHATASGESNLTESVSATENNSSIVAATTDTVKSEKIKQLLLEKEAVDKELLENNIWSKIYSNYHTYKELEHKKEVLGRQIKKLESKKKRNKDDNEILAASKEEYQTLQGKLQLLKEYEKDPFKKLLTPPDIGEVPTVGNPFAIIGALSYLKKLNSDQEEYNNRYKSLQHIVEKLGERREILKKLQQLDPQNETYQQEYRKVEDEIKTFTPVLDIFKTTNNVHTKKIDEITLNLKNDIKREMEKAMNIGAVILVFILLLLIIKYFVRKYMSDNERFYTINKALNITFIFLMIMTLLLAYIENVSYLVTILGFASAGIAIAMKDWFMSLMGWFAIILGGSIHVGDRVKFVKDGVEYIGDIVDISLLRMTLHEDVTLTTYMHNRRSGRIIFIPNNYVFTDMIANYSHAGLKTVWDGIDFMITFDSDVQKAASIAKEVTRKYSKGYTDITRKQLNKLRSQYSIRNTNVEPRILTFIEDYGMKISAWYLTNSYATLTLRSTISAEIIRRLHEEENITLAYPTQSIYIDKDVRKPKPQHPDIPMGEETY